MKNETKSIEIVTAQADTDVFGDAVADRIGMADTLALHNFDSLQPGIQAVVLNDKIQNCPQHGKRAEFTCV